MRINIYQLKDPAKCAYGFATYLYAKSHNLSLYDYKQVYALVAPDMDPEQVCSDMYKMYSKQIPEGFLGKPLGISDVIQIDNDYYYCNNIGWVKFKGDH